MDQLVTREMELFQVSDRNGDFPGEGAYGLFTRDTRFLSRCELLVNGEKPTVLRADAALNYVQQVFGQAGLQDPLFYRTTVEVRRSRVLYGGAMHERITLINHEQRPVQPRVLLQFAADFADLFEVRGARRTGRGEMLPPELKADSVLLGYRGLDRVLRQTEIRFSVAPSELNAHAAAWQLKLEPKSQTIIDVLVLPTEAGVAGVTAPVGSYDAALGALQRSYAEWREGTTSFSSDSELLNRVLDRSAVDLRVLLADHGHGHFPVAGMPWFAVPFGRDSLITAIQTLSVNPDLARGTLRTMAALQGQEEDAFRQEEPGKIAHELRFGEMARLNEIPFRRYYGSVDSTPLFLVLLCEYYAWTGDLDLIRELLPAAKAAVGWIRTYGDSDGDGLLEYRADQGMGLTVQSWKDSHDSMCHRDGTPAASPVAVSEVQGYAYDAMHRLAPILAKLGEDALGSELHREAEALKARFNQSFWMADRQFPALALDGDKRQVGTVASDIGHCLWSGIVDEAKAPAVAERLVAPDMFSGWGIRTLSAGESTYNPLSYHNGSVWPHDNSLCVLGLKRYGFDAEANKVATGLIEAAAHFEYFRLPELFCGHANTEGRPVDYPVACSPQAWAAATPFALVQAFLGLAPDAAAGVLRLRPRLPAWLGRLSVRNLRVGAALVQIEVDQDSVRATVTGGDLQVLVGEGAFA